MPEMIEVETYRLTADRALGRKIVSVYADDEWFLKRGLTKRRITRALKSQQFVGTRRIGKLLLIDLDSGDVLGLRFGMTGVLVFSTDITDPGADTDMVYRNHQIKPEWNRFGVGFADGSSMSINDPRRLGGVELDPDESQLGPDALSITTKELGVALAGSKAPLKARMMDQRHVAGIGNLLADEILWRAGYDPAREARSLDDDEVKNLRSHLVKTVKSLTTRGGSHRGDMFEDRVRDGICPRDGTVMQRRTVGGRTTYSCPLHQR